MLGWRNHWKLHFLSRRLSKPIKPPKAVQPWKACRGIFLENEAASMLSTAARARRFSLICRL
jgi:hypothetical protein